MSISSIRKGVESIKSIHTVKKSIIPNNEDSVFLKLYMLEKERTRLVREESTILTRLQNIQNRLADIQNYYNEKSGLLQNNDTDSFGNVNGLEKNQEFKSMSIDY
jgi:hypothetical protein